MVDIISFSSPVVFNTGYHHDEMQVVYDSNNKIIVAYDHGKNYGYGNAGKR